MQIIVNYTICVSLLKSNLVYKEFNKIKIKVSPTGEI
jgi:hypothetical protein